MNLKFYLGLLMLVVSINSTAQIATLQGKITDGKTGKAVPGASILSGSFGTSADDDGSFVFYIQQSIVEQSGITVSCIGYQTIHLTNITDNESLILTPIVHELKSVDISVGAEYIVQKAYSAIHTNYLDKNFNITGFQRMVHTIRDTFGYQYYYQNNAKIKIYMSPYADTPLVADVGLIEKDEILKKNPMALRIPFINGYRIAVTHDYVHTGATILKGNPGKFRYMLNRKELIDGRKTYVVNFFSKFNDINAGILYIDSATYGFVKILYTKYNVKTPHAIDLDKVTLFIQYRKYDDKWGLDAVKYNSITAVRGYSVERGEEFKTEAVNTQNAVQLPAMAVIKKRAIDDVVKPCPDFSSADKKTSDNAQKLAETNFIKIKAPKIANSVH